MTIDFLVELCLQHVRNLNVFVVITFVMALLIWFSRWKSNYWFFVMTFVWCSINYGIGVWLKDHINVFSYTAVDTALPHVKNMILINVFLDVLYFFVAWLLYPKAKESKYFALKSQFSQAIVVQAMGLLFLDIAFYLKLIAPISH